jgi:hypothetical protein
MKTANSPCGRGSTGIPRRGPASDIRVRLPIDRACAFPWNLISRAKTAGTANPSEIW